MEARAEGVVVIVSACMSASAACRRSNIPSYILTFFIYLAFLYHDTFHTKQVSVALMAFMPKMMEGLDDEQRQQMRQQMATQNQMMTDPTKAFSNLFGEMSGSEDDSNAAANRQRRIESSKVGGKTARRGKRD